MRDSAADQGGRKPRRTPVWKAIAAALRDDIAEGRYRPGDRLPSEAVLAERFGVNRHTLRHAVQALVAEKLVRTRRGAGAFVMAQPTDYPLGARVRFHENLRAAGRMPGKRILSLEVRAATAGEAGALQIDAGAAVLGYHGLSLADGMPVALAESAFPLGRLPGLDAALAECHSVTAALGAVGVVDYTRASTRITATLATATQALHLHVAEGAALLRTTALNIAGNGLPVEYGRTWFVGDRMTLTLEGD